MASGAVNALASFGRFEAGVQFVVFTLVGLSCCASGMSGLSSRDPQRRRQSIINFMCAIVIVLVGYLIYSFAQSSRTGAAVMGGVGAYDIGSNLLGNR
jgi:hypothetical protein